MNLPVDFVQNILNGFGDEGRRWLERLPDLISEASRRWKLAAVNPVPKLSYNFVAFARRGDEDVVLKIGVPDRESASGMMALKCFAGSGAVRLLETDEESGAFLLDRIKPGKMLSTLEDDDQATNIAADVMLKLWQPLEPSGLPLDGEQHASGLHNSFIKLTDWFAGLDRLRPTFNGGTGPLPEKIISRVEQTLPQLFAGSGPPRLIHGDLHHFNILSSQHGTATPGWLAIDPKGVVGPAEYEVGPFLINPMPAFLNGSDPQAQSERRIAILSERLGCPRQRLQDWGLCHAVLSAWWDMTPDGKGGDYSIQCAEIFANI